MQQSMRKEKLRKVRLCFIAGCFRKSFNMIINHCFCFASSFAAQFLLFGIRMMQEISKQEVGNGKQLGMTNNMYFKNNFNRLAINITQKTFFTDKMCINVHI